MPVEDLAKSYQKGVAYLDVARRVMIVIRRLDDVDAADLRRASDRLIVRGLDLLTGVMRKPRGRAAHASDDGSEEP